MTVVLCESMECLTKFSKVIVQQLGSPVQLTRVISLLSLASLACERAFKLCSTCNRNCKAWRVLLNATA